MMVLSVDKMRTNAIGIVCAMILLLCFITKVRSHICPLSSVMDLNNTHSYFYPLDIYAPHDIIEQVKAQNRTVTCYSATLNAARVAHNCSTVKFCPVHTQNVIDATRNKYNDSASLCYLKKKLSNPQEHVRLIIFGGSIPSGSNAQWCNAFDDDFRYYVHLRCAWPYFFGEWMKQSNAAKVSVINLSRGGQDSILTMRLMLSDMQKNGITGFTANDIILLDHSVNDDWEKLQYLIEKDVESILRRIYSLSANDSWPYIVLLDASPKESHGPQIEHYQKAYWNVSRYFNIPIWSYTDAVRSEYANRAQTKYKDYINFNNNHERDAHPPWHVQLFMADLYSAVMQSEFDRCTQHQEELSERLHTSLLHLPPPRLAEESTIECKSDLVPFMSMTYPTVKDNTSIGAFTSTPENTWQAREDLRGRGGFIIELNGTESDRYPPWDDQKLPTISFTTVKTTEELMFMHSILVQIMFLKTYHNAGRAVVLLCGVPWGKELDALWQDYEHNHASLPEWIETRLFLADCKARNFTHPTVQFVHHALNEPWRGHNKFKVLNVKVCAGRESRRLEQFN